MSENTLLTEEHFVVIEDFPNYSVSNLGRVVNNKTGKDKAAVVRKGGHIVIQLHRNGLSYKIPLRKLVANAFFAEFKSWHPVYLLSDDKSDCSVMNITLTAPADRPEKFILIVELNQIFTTAKEAARRINGSDGVILKVLMGMGKTHKGYTFKWVYKK